MIKDASRDGLRAVKCALEDKCVIAGAGSFEIAAYRMLMRRKAAVSGKAKLGVEAFAQSLLVIPKILAENSALDVQDVVIKCEEAQDLADDECLQKDDGTPNTSHTIGINLDSGEPFYPATEGIYDSFLVKRQSMQLATILATQLLLVDEVMKAGKSMGAPPPQEDDE